MGCHHGISGAVVSSGLLAVEGGSKRVQHQEGGIVRDIYARDGDLVRAGALLVRLDGTTAAANLAVVDSQLSEALALKARLAAEGLRADTIGRPAEAQVLPASAKFEEMLASQVQLRDSRREAQDALAARLNEQIDQIEVQITGLEAQKAAVDEEAAVRRGGGPTRRSALCRWLDRGHASQCGPAG